MSAAPEVHFDPVRGQIATPHPEPLVWEVWFEGRLAWRCIIAPGRAIAVPADVRRLIEFQGEAVTFETLEVGHGGGAQCGRIVGKVRGIVIRCSWPPNHEPPHRGIVEWFE